MSLSFSNKDIIGYFESSCDVPEEIILAAGLMPVKILGDPHKDNSLADKYLQEYLCPAARSFFVEAFEHSKDWKGFVIGHGCDATNRQFDIWKRHIETPFLYWFNMPMNVNEIAKYFLKQEMMHFIKALESSFHTKITEEKLNDAIDYSNKVKALLRVLGKLRRKKDIPNVEYFDICTYVLRKKGSDVVKFLLDTIDKWETYPEFPKNKKKIILTGSDVTYREFFEILDEANLRVVADDLSIGERYYARPIPIREDPINALVEYYLSIPRPATRNPPDPRAPLLEKCIKETEAQGIVSQNLKFCEPYAFDSVFLIGYFKQRGIPIIHIERDFSTLVDAQTLNRLEAFYEML